MLSNSGIASRSLTFVLAGGQGRRLDPLTLDRAKPVVAFGGKYRLIDFTISNCVNSGLRRINILTQQHSESIDLHIRALNRQILCKPHRGESLLCLSPATGKRYRGTADAVFQNLSILEREKADFVVILSADHVYRMDYRDLIRRHSDSGSDVTVSAMECPIGAASQFGVFEADSAGHVTGFVEKPVTPKAISTKPSRSLVSMGVYVFNRRTLIDALSADAEADTSHDFGRDIIPALVQCNRVSVYNFSQAPTRLGSYWRDVGTLDAYFRANMELLSSPILDPYEDAKWPLYSVESFNVRASRRRARNADAAVDSVMPFEGSFESGSSVTHSVLSSRVQIERYATVNDSILLHNVRVGAGARIQRAIIAENVWIADGVEIGYGGRADSTHGFVTDHGIVVIPANTHIGSSGEAFAA